MILEINSQIEPQATKFDEFFYIELQFPEN